MESASLPKKRKKFYQSDFLTRPALRLAALLFLVFQAVKLVRLFSDAISYKKINQVTPEDFTMAAVTGAILMIGLAAWIFVILTRQHKGLCQIRRGNRFLLLDLLLAVYGFVRVIAQVVLFFQNFEILFLSDVLAIAGGLIAPPLILFLADRQRIPPGDLLLMILGAGTMGLSLLSFIMVAISIGKDYTVLHALPELAFRLGLLLAGLAALRTALKLRAELPIDTPLVTPKAEKAPKASRKLRPRLNLFDNLPGYDDEEPEISLFDDGAPEDEAYEPDEDVPEASAPEEEEPDEYVSAAPAPRPAVQTPVDERGRAVCLGCGRRFPAYLGVCPHCGLDMDTPAPSARALEDESTYSEPQRAPEPPEPPRRAAADTRAVCAGCGKRFPAYLGVCPHCGLDMDGSEALPSERKGY